MTLALGLIAMNSSDLLSLDTDEFKDFCQQDIWCTQCFYRGVWANKFNTECPWCGTYLHYLNPTSFYSAYQAFVVDKCSLKI